MIVVPTYSAKGRQYIGHLQQGYAWTIILASLVLISLSFASQFVSKQRPSAYINQTTQRALMTAREALIAYALQEDSTPGAFLCPDQDYDGAIEGVSEGAACKKTETIAGRGIYVGRLPWKTLGLPPLKDGNGECVWYMLAANYSNRLSNRGLKDPALNPTLVPTLKIYHRATHTTTEAIAVIISPGNLRAGQKRSLDSVPTHCNAGTSQNFLEASAPYDNAQGPDLIDDSSGEISNDIIVPIERSQLFPALAQRVLATLAHGEDGKSGLENYIRDPAITLTALTRPTSSTAWRAKSTTLLNRTTDNREAIDTQLQPNNEKLIVPFTIAYDALGCPQFYSDHEIYKNAAARWLCRNDWYSYIEFIALDANHAQLRYIDPTLTSVRLQRDLNRDAYH